MWPVFSGSESIQVIGGAEVQQAIIARALARAGYRVSLISLDYGQPDGHEIDGVRCYRGFKPDAGIPVLRFLHPRLTSVWRAMKRANADVYYTRSTSMLTGVVAAFCRRYGRKSIYAGASDLDFLPGRQRIQYARDRWLFEYGLRRADAVIVQNAHQYSTCALNYGRKPHFIPSCYIPPEAATADRNGFVLWVANIREVKQPEVCLEIARRLPRLDFVMIGGALSHPVHQSYFEAFQARVREVPNVKFLGFVPYREVEGYFSQARVFLNTSRSEGFPNTFLQAWARGLPTVAFFDTGSRDGEKPVYRIAADVEEAVTEIERLMNDGAYWKQASDRCLEHYRSHHSTAAVTGLYSKVIAEVLRGNG